MFVHQVFYIPYTRLIPTREMISQLGLQVDPISTHNFTYRRSFPDIKRVRDFVLHIELIDYLVGVAASNIEVRDIMEQLSDLGSTVLLFQPLFRFTRYSVSLCVGRLVISSF